MMTFRAPSAPFRAIAKSLISHASPRFLPRFSAPHKALKNKDSAPFLPCLPLKGEGWHSIESAFPRHRLNSSKGTNGTTVSAEKRVVVAGPDRVALYVEGAP